MLYLDIKNAFNAIDLRAMLEVPRACGHPEQDVVQVDGIPFTRIPRTDAEKIESMLRDLHSMVPAIRSLYISKNMQRRLANGELKLFGSVKNKADEAGTLLLLNARQSFVPADPSVPWSKYLGERTYASGAEKGVIIRFLEERSNGPFPIPKLYLIGVDTEKPTPSSKGNRLSFLSFFC